MNLDTILSQTQQMSRYTDYQLSQALEALSQGLTYREASSKFDVPLATLSDKKKEKYSLPKGRQTSIPKDIEEAVVKAVLDCATAGFPLTKRQVLLKVGRLSQQLNLRTQFKNGMPGDKYWRYLTKDTHNRLFVAPNVAATNG